MAFGALALLKAAADEAVVTQETVDDGLDIWQRLVVAGNADPADTINAEFAKCDNQQAFVGLTFNEWFREIGMLPLDKEVYMPLATSDAN
jgi:hypothetical protein